MGQTQWVLEAVEGEYTGRRFGVTERGLTFGREADNDLVLLDDNISRHHALVRISDDRPLLEDRNSRNGTFVNNQRVSRIRLKEGDRIAVGSHLFLMRLLSKDEEPPEDTDAERTVIARPTPAQLRRTQAVQLFSPEAMAYQQKKRERENLAPPPRRGPQRVEPVRTAEDESSGPILGGAAAASGAAAGGVAPSPGDFPPLPESLSRETLDDDAGTVLLRADATARQDEPVGEAVSPEFDAPPQEFAASEPLSPEMGAAPELASTPPVDLEDASPFDDLGGTAGRSGSPTKRLAVVGGSVAGGLILLMALYAQFNKPVEGDTSASHATPVPAVQAPSSDAASMFQFTENQSSSSKPSVGLTEEEKALPEAERVSLANEHFDQGERFMESDKLNAALEEFEKALALNPSCKVCVIRISKVQAEIRKEIEKYKSDALRAYQAMEYDKAKRYWEMVLELERDPAGRRVAVDGLKKAIKQLKQKSYR